jgi:1A family penicillin-binding protein
MPVSYLAQSPLNRFRPPWYTRPRFYIPLGLAAVVIILGIIFAFSVANDLDRQAAIYDLSRLEEMESASVIVDRNNKIFGQIYVENRETIPYEQLPRDLINAVVSVEDNKFYQHNGYDLIGIVRATLKNVTAGHVRQGASTITQQLARNSFSLKARTFRRKLLEIFLARRIEQKFGKQKIMELYLNRIYFGGGLYGAEAAARGYFGKPARELSLAEAATLAGLIKAPNKLSPWSDRDASRDARNFVLTRMQALGFISAQKCASAQAEALTTGDRQSARGQTYAVDYIRQQVISAVGWDRAMNEGFRIHTTIDSDMQKVAEESLRAHLDQAEKHPGYSHQTYADYAAKFRKGSTNFPAPEYLQGAVIALDNTTGGILALVGGRDFEHNQYDRALQAKRPAGTAMTPFVFAAAFEKGLYPGSILEDSALDNRAAMIGGTTGILGEWGPEREDNRYEGPITSRMALAKGKNGATIRLGMNPGVDAVIQLCHDAGVKSQLRPFPATFLGSSEITLVELALAYTIFPNGGWRANAPHILDRIEDKDGSVVWQADEDRTRKTALKPEVAYEVHSCLVDALQNGTGQAAHKELGLKKFPAAGKTGTAYDFTDALFAGYDSALTCVVWAGFDKPQKIYRGAFGSEIALPVWVDIMNASLPEHAPREIAKPPGLQTVEICTRSGLLATDKCYDTVKNDAGETVQRRTTYRELATKAQIPAEPCDVHGDASGRIVRDLPEAEWPRAALAVDIAQVPAIMAKGPTLIAEDDPYDSVRSTAKPKPEVPVAQTPAPVETNQSPGTAAENGLPDPTKPVLKAQPVAPAERPPVEQTPVEIRRAEPVRPMDQVPDADILKSTPPPSLDLGDPGNP